MLARGGFLPFSRKLGKMKSSALAYGVSFRHVSSKAANSGCKGTGRLDALLFGGPNLPYTYARVTRMQEFFQSISDQRNARISLMRSPVAASASTSTRCMSPRLERMSTHWDSV